MRLIKIVEPRGFWKAYRSFHRIMLWLWFGGIALCISVAAMRLGKFWLSIVFILTIYPAIIGWLGFNGIGLLLTTLPQLRQRQAAKHPKQWLLVTVLMLVGLTFSVGAVGLLLAVLWAMVA